MEDSTGLLRTDCKKVSRPGVIAPAEDGILFDLLFQIFNIRPRPVKASSSEIHQNNKQLDLH